MLNQSRKKSPPEFGEEGWEEAGCEEASLAVCARKEVTKHVKNKSKRKLRRRIISPPICASPGGAGE
jgi:hypothetical protein